MYLPLDLADRPSQFLAGLSCEARARQSLLRPSCVAFGAFSLKTCSDAMDYLRTRKGRRYFTHGGVGTVE